MAATFRIVRTGDPLRIEADTWNALMDMGSRYNRSRFSGGGSVMPPSSSSRNVILVKNTTANPLDPCAVVRITGAVFTPSDNVDGFRNQPCLTVDTPDSAGTDRIAVILDGIAAGALGDAIVSGPVVVKVDMTASGDLYAAPISGSSASFKSGAVGLPILYAEPGTGVKWAVVRLGGGGGGGSSTVRIASNMTGGEKYNAFLVSPPATAVPAAGNLTNANLGASTAISVMVVNSLGAGRSTHMLAVDQVLMATFIGMSDETPARRVYQVDGVNPFICGDPL